MAQELNAAAAWRTSPGSISLPTHFKCPGFGLETLYDMVGIAVATQPFCPRSINIAIVCMVGEVCEFPLGHKDLRNVELIQSVSH